MTCPSCRAPALTEFYHVAEVPIESVVLHRSREAAVHCPRGDVKLAFCGSCGFITNIAFDPDAGKRATAREDTQACSETFGAFHHRLAETLIDRYGLRGRKILEIGCGRGEFLELLCRLGGNRGIGVDPAYSPGIVPEDGDLTFINETFNPDHVDEDVAFICCKMTLEHVFDTAGFVSTVRRAIRSAETVVFFQVPDTVRILQELGFWDIYYDHCSYFSPASLRALFRREGFRVCSLEREFGGQYLTLEARPGAPDPNASPAEEAALLEDLQEIGEAVSFFAGKHQESVRSWKQRLEAARERNERTALWGSGSKAVGFLCTLDAVHEVECVVDINPRKQGTYSPGTGHEIVSPSFLESCRPDNVVVMNPMYVEEIQSMLHRMELDPIVVAV